LLNLAPENDKASTLSSFSLQTYHEKGNQGVTSFYYQTKHQGPHNHAY